MKKQVITANNLETIISFIENEKKKGNNFIDSKNAGEFSRPTISSNYFYADGENSSFLFANKIFVDELFWRKNKKIIRELIQNV